MFNLIKSNRMENLAQALCTVIGENPDNPILSEFIGIQSRGLKHTSNMMIPAPRPWR